MMPKRKVVVFDLDDTLYKEVDFLKSGYRYIACRLAVDGVYEALWNTYQKGEGDPFGTVIRDFGITDYGKEDLLNWYRYHLPEIALSDDVKRALRELKDRGDVLGIISDGRRETQMNKVKALGLLAFVEAENIVINDVAERFKPDERSFRGFMERYGQDCDFVYVGDNTAKDFVAPNVLGWTTVCLLDDGRNVHRQRFDLEESFLPKYRVKKLGNIGEIPL